MTGLQSVAARGLLVILLIVGCSSAPPEPIVQAPERAETMEPAEESTGSSARGTGLVRCALPENVPQTPRPACPMGTTASVSNDAWGPCVTPSLCACTSFERDCPDMQGYSEGCYQGHCGPWLR